MAFKEVYVLKESDSIINIYESDEDAVKDKEEFEKNDREEHQMYDYHIMVYQMKCINRENDNAMFFLDEDGTDTFGNIEFPGEFKQPKQLILWDAKQQKTRRFNLVEEE